MTRRPEPASPRRSERATECGAVAPVVVAALVIASALAFGVARVGVAAVTRARVQTAADASALAAADTLALGRGAAAARVAAEETAADNGARLTRCRCTGRIVDVTASRRIRLLGPLVVEVEALARAEIRPTSSEFAP